MNWRYTHIEHGPRLALGLKFVQYSVLDLIFKSQTHPTTTQKGWCSLSVRQIGEAFDLSIGGVQNILDECLKDDFLEVHPDTKRLRRTTRKFYDIAYLKTENEIVHFLNVHKMNDQRSENERKRSENEQTPYNSNKRNKEVSNGRFIPPAIEECISYFIEKGSTEALGKKFFYFYDGKGWMVGKNKMKKWKMAASGWITDKEEKRASAGSKKEKNDELSGLKYD